MKSAWIGYSLILFGVMLFAGCKNGAKSNRPADSDPIFQSNLDLRNITQLIDKTPKDAALYYERGGMLYKLKQDSLALKDYKMAASLDTNQARNYSAVGDMLFEHKDITGSIQWIQKAINKNPTDRKAHLKIAKLFLYLQEYPQAFGEINIVLRQNVYDPEAYFLKGMVYKNMKDTAKAISNFLTSVQVSPDYRDAVIQLGLLYCAQRNEVGLKYLDNAFKMDSTDVFPIFAKGTYYQEINDEARAKEFYRACVVRNSHYVNALFNMGYILMQEDSVEKAYRQYNIVTKIDPLNPAAYFNRGLCSEMLNNMKDAVADYRQALALDSTYDRPKDAMKRLGLKK